MGKVTGFVAFPIVYPQLTNYAAEVHLGQQK